MVSNISFSNELKHINNDKWNKILNHKFVIEIAEDILPVSKFSFYLKQDQIFLKAFCHLLTAAALIAYDKQSKVWFESLIDTTTKYEMPMQNKILHQFEGNLELESSEVAAEETTMNYVSYMKKVSNFKDLASIVSAMAPCPWTYYEITKALNKSDTNEVFKPWIQFYSSKESLNQVNQIQGLLNKLAGNADERKKIKMKNYFSISCNFELEFWNMAYSYMK